MRCRVGPVARLSAKVSVAVLCVASCGSSLTVTSIRSGSDVQFDFGRDVFVGTIDVGETGATPGASPACVVKSAGPIDPAIHHSRGWVYGQALNPLQVPTSPCMQLVPGHNYNIRLFHSGHCFTKATFRVSNDGSIQLGPSFTSCWM